MTRLLVCLSDSQHLGCLGVELCKAGNAGDRCALELTVDKSVVLNVNVACGDHLKSIALVKADGGAGIAEQRMSFAPRGLPGSPVPWKLSPARGF